MPFSNDLSIILNESNIHHLAVQFTLGQRFQLDKAWLIELEDVLKVGLLQAPPEDSAVLAVKHSLLVDLYRGNIREFL